MSLGFYFDLSRCTGCRACQVACKDRNELPDHVIFREVQTYQVDVYKRQIVGGSILSHDHFQGGRHVLPLMKAPIERNVALPGTPQVRCGIVRWPASTLRLVSEDRVALARVAARRCVEETALRSWLLGRDDQASQKDVRGKVESGRMHPGQVRRVARANLALIHI